MVRFEHTKISGGHWFVRLDTEDCDTVIHWCMVEFGPSRIGFDNGDGLWRYRTMLGHIEIEIYDDAAATAFKLWWC